MKKPEVLYYIRALDDKRCAVSKFEEGDLIQTYVITNSNCDCPGAVYHKVECKHLRIKKTWEGLNRGAFAFEVKGNKVHIHPLKDPNDGQEPKDSESTGG